MYCYWKVQYMAKQKSKGFQSFKEHAIRRLKLKSTYVSLSAFFAAVQYQYTEVLIDDIAALFILFCSLALIFAKGR